MKQLYANIINIVANTEKTIVQNGGRVYIGQVDVTEELIAIINQTAEVCVDYAFLRKRWAEDLKRITEFLGDVRTYLTYAIEHSVAAN